MGLFDHPFVDEREPEQVVASTEHLELAREVASSIHHFIKE